MLYRYPTEQKKTAQETVAGNRRYDNYTGEELPPVPYIHQGQSTGSQPAAGSASGGKAQAARTTAANNTAAADSAEIRRQQKIDNYTALRDREKSYLGANYTAQRSAAKADNENAMRNLYIAYMQGKRNMPQQTALWGAGGEIESLKTRHRLNYEDNRAKQAREYSSILDDIQQRYNSDLWELEQKYLKQIMNL